MDEDIQRRIRDIINEIERKSADGDYIYRGEPKTHEEPPHCGKISSNLWREYGLEMENFNIEAIQKEILNGAKKHIGDLPQDFRIDLAASLNMSQEDTDETIDFEILTEIQHYGGKTNLIDFTTDYLIALFFACDGHHDKDGRVISQRTEEIQNMIRRPRNPRHRVIAQKSVFVRPPKGFLNKPHKDNVVIIPSDLKQWILQHLQTYHAIFKETIYNDLYGFIKYQDIHGDAYTQFYNGYASLKRGDEATTFTEGQEEYKKSIEYFTQAIKLERSFFEAYHGRGLAHKNISEVDSAIEDYNKAIDLNSNFAEAYNNRGITHEQIDDYESAIKDYNKAIELNPDLDEAYNNRGVVYYKRGDYHRAIVDYTKTIDLNPDDAIAYYNRGEALLHLSKWEEAKADLTTAKDKGANIVNEFHKEYESVADFQSRTGITLPTDIAEMLTST